MKTLLLSILLTTSLGATAMTCPAQLSSCPHDPFWQLCSISSSTPLSLSSVLIPKTSVTGKWVKCIYGGNPFFFIANMNTNVAPENLANWEIKMFSRQLIYTCDQSAEACAFMPQAA